MTHIAYYNTDDEKLVYRSREATGWTQTIFDYDTVCETIAVDSQGKAHMIISISGPTHHDPPYIFPDPPVESYHLSNASGDWQIERVGALGRSSEILIDSLDKIHLVINHGLITYATNSSGSWLSEVVNPEGSPINQIKTMQFYIDESQVIHLIYQMDEGVFYDGYCVGECEVLYFKHAEKKSGSWTIQDIAVTNYFQYFERNTITSGAPHYIGFLRQQGMPPQYIYFVSVQTLSFSDTLTYEIFPAATPPTSGLIDRPNLIPHGLFKCEIDKEGIVRAFYYEEDDDEIVYITNKQLKASPLPALINLLLSNG